MIRIYVKEVDTAWFGVAFTREKIVATSVNLTEERTTRSLLRSMPMGVEYQIAEESLFAEETILMLRELHVGNEEHKSFAIASEYFSEPAVKVLTVAAAIPIG